MSVNLFEEPDDGVLRVGADDMDVLSMYRFGHLPCFNDGSLLSSSVKIESVRVIFAKYGKTSIAIANASLESIRQDSLKNYGRGGHD